MSAQPQVNNSHLSASVVTDSPRCTFRTSEQQKMHHASPRFPYLSLPLPGPQRTPPPRIHSYRLRTRFFLRRISHSRRRQSCLTKLWELLARDRISGKRAATFAYIAALLYLTIERVRVGSNMTGRNPGFDAWKEALARSFPPRKSIQSPTLEK